MGKIPSRRKSRSKDLRRREESPSGTKGSSLQLGQEHLRHMRGRGSQLGQALKAIPSSLVFVLVTQSCLTLCDPLTVVCQAPLSMGFSRQEYWSSLPYPSTGDLPDPGTEPGLLHYRGILYHLSHQESLLSVFILHIWSLK